MIDLLFIFFLGRRAPKGTIDRTITMKYRLSVDKLTALRPYLMTEADHRQVAWLA
ncbi:hypothetical protein [Pseudomonas sp. WCS374]|uniref:hypothetical protein n=1 Tax=Pseudomonas sp. WCS374 TaxID=1495331 RepID=UPI0012DF1EF9|nr:hypothetical protein [Pseudomonas sp. WCS374]